MFARCTGLFMNASWRVGSVSVVIPTFSPQTDQRQWRSSAGTFAVWNSALSDAIWRLCRDAIFDRRVLSFSRGTSWFERLWFVSASICCRGVVVASAGVAPAREIDPTRVSETIAVMSGRDALRITADLIE